MKSWKAMEVQLHAFLISIIYANKRSASLSGNLNPRIRASDTRSTGLSGEEGSICFCLDSNSSRPARFPITVLTKLHMSLGGGGSYFLFSFYFTWGEGSGLAFGTHLYVSLKRNIITSISSAIRIVVVVVTTTIRSICTGNSDSNLVWARVKHGQLRAVPSDMLHITCVSRTR
jgi:hypothetical protein